LQALESRQAFNDGSQWIAGESGGKCLIVQISLQVLLNGVIEALDEVGYMSTGAVRLFGFKKSAF